MVKSSDPHRAAWLVVLLLAASCGEGREENRVEGQAAWLPTAVAEPRRDAERSLADPQAAIPGSGPRALDQTASATVALGDGIPAPQPSVADGSPPPSAGKATRDVFGDTPDEFGYYSQKLHFELDSPDPIRRSQVLLEKDADGTLHLRLSKQDIDRMPRIDEVLPPVEGGPDGPTPPGPDPNVPEPKQVEYEADEEGIATWEKLVVTPPLEGYRIEISGKGFTDEWTMEAFETTGGKKLWSVPYTAAPGWPYPRIEFARDNPKRFYMCEVDHWLRLFDLDRGLLCQVEASTRVDGAAWIANWPVFLGDLGQSLLFGHERGLWLISYPDCASQRVGSAAPPAQPGTLQSRAAYGTFSTDRRFAWVATPEIAIERGAIRQRFPQRLVLRLLEQSGPKEWRTTRTLAARVFNSFNGLGIALAATVPEPFLEVYLACSGAVGGLPGSPPRPRDCFLLAANRLGRVMAARMIDSESVALTVDPARAAIRSAGKWWDLQPWAEVNREDVVGKER